MGRADRNSRKPDRIGWFQIRGQPSGVREGVPLWLLVCGIAMVFAMTGSSACSPGRVDLVLGQSGGTDSIGSGSGGVEVAQSGSGGRQVEIDVNEGEGGEFGSGGLGDGPKNPMKPVEPLGYGPPCLLRGGCLPLCDHDPQACLPCEQSESCSWPFPYCDVALESCVECLTGADCQRNFGGEFPACSAGKCVQCQGDDDCGDGEICFFGLCGECRKHYDCELGESCIDRRCVIFTPPAEVDGSGGVTQ
jgi:hypothetical protein